MLSSPQVSGLPATAQAGRPVPGGEHAATGSSQVSSGLRVLAEPDWLARRAAHEQRVRAWTDPHQARQARGEKHPVEVIVLLDEVLKLIRATLPADIRIVFDHDAERAAVLADASQLHQVMLNICTNAAYAMKERGGTLSVKVESIEIDATQVVTYPVLSGGKYASITITDSGHGMEESVRERIFEPYFTTKPAGEGSGLGLSIVKAILERHGATVTVTSTPGDGATFTVTFPPDAPASPA